MLQGNSKAIPPHQTTKQHYSLWANTVMFVMILRRRVAEDQNIQMAAALAYNTLFSLLPTLVLALLVLSIISGSDSERSVRKTAAEKTPTSMTAGETQPATSPATVLVTTTKTKPQATTMVGQTQASTNPAATLEAATDEATAGTEPASSIGTQTQEWLLQQLGFDQIQIVVTHKDKSQEEVALAKVIGKRIQEVRHLVQSPGTGAIAFGVLLYGVLSLMLVVERAFNTIYRSPKNRTWVRRFSLYTCLFIWGPMGVAGSIGLTQILHSKTGDVHWLQTVIATFSVVASLFVSWLLLLIVYKLIPETVVRWRSAMLGALVGAVLWETGKYGFGIYLRYSVGTRSWYGNLALVPLFMLWIYITWHFVLAGLQIAYIHQYFEPLSKRVRAARTFRIPVADLNWVLPLGVLLFKKFKEGKPLEADEAAESISIPPDVSSLLLGALATAGIAHVVDGGQGGGGYALSRPPEKITAQDLLDAARGLCQVTETASTAPALHATGLEQYTWQKRQWGEQYTLPTLAGEGELPGATVQRKDAV